MDRKIEHKGIIRKKHIPFIAGGLFLIVVSLWIVFGNHAATMNVNKNLLTISDVEQAEFKDYVRVTGTVAPIEVVQISAIEGGVVTEKVVEEGAHVRKGDVIIRLDNSNLDLQILNAEAELAEKQNLLRNTQVAMQQDRLNNEMELASLDMDAQRKRRNYEQMKRLYSEKLVAKEEYMKAKEEYELVARKKNLITKRLRQDSIYRSVQMDQMEDNLQNMRKNVVLVRERKGKLEVRSTIDGELGLLDVKLGQNISPGALIGQINNLSAFRIEAQIDEHYIDRVRQGLMANFQRDGRSYNIRVRKVFPEVREGKFRVEFAFSKQLQHPEAPLNPPERGETPNTKAIKNTSPRSGGQRGASPSGCQSGTSDFRIGQTFYLDLELGQPSQAILIPRGTFFQATGGQWIFVLDKDGKKAYRRQIRIGRQNPGYYEVLEGLEPGERVITSGYEAFKDNEILQLE